jgi:bifunctional pyridoxal-dependent enzyme with beta-cystathionase and maltose regulon repressor activities
VLASGGSSDEEYERMTAAEVLEKLEEVSQRRCTPTSLHSTALTFTLQAWINEKFAPDLLEYKTEIVESIMLQIKEMVHDR